MRIRLVLPQPEGPTTLTKAPLGTCRFTSLSASTRLASLSNTLFTPQTSMAAERAVSLIPMDIVPAFGKPDQVHQKGTAHRENVAHDQSVTTRFDAAVE